MLHETYMILAEALSDPTPCLPPGFSGPVSTALGWVKALSLVIGVVESLTKAYIGTITGGVITSAFSDAIVFGILIIVLLVKPSGLMGEPETEKV